MESLKSNPLSAPDLTHCDGPAAALEMAAHLNKVKSEEAPKKKTTIKIDERLILGSPNSDGARPETAKSDDICDGKNLITPAEYKGRLARDMSERKKWRILIILFFLQISMNLNCSLYSSAIPGIAKQFDRSEDAARWGAAVFLIAYAVGCELWAPWSEELGRFWVLQLSLFLVNVFQFGVGFANNLETVIAFRVLGGLSTAGGSISLGVVADLWDKEHHQIPVAFIVFASVGGSILGPIAGGFIESKADWQWAIWLQALFGFLVQFLHYWGVPETRSSIITDRIAKQRRDEAKRNGKVLNLYGLNEVTPFAQRFSLAELFKTWSRPFMMFFQEPIVLALSLLSGFSDALIFVFVQCFGPIYRQRGFTTEYIGLTFIPFLIGYLIAWISFIPAIARNKKRREKNPTSERAQFESRLWWLLFLAPCLPIGLLGWAWTSNPPVPWIASMFFITLCGIANCAIYMATIDYMLTAYGPYSASATGGNGFARDFLAGVLTPAAIPYYNLPLGPKHIQLASTILAIIATILVGCVFIIYRCGPWLRHKSKFAQKLEAASKRAESNRVIIGLELISSGSGSALTSKHHSIEDLTAFHSPLYHARSQSTPDFSRSRVGFSRNVSPSIRCVCSSTTSLAGDSKTKRPSPPSRTQSLYHYQAQAERDVTITDPALLQPPQLETSLSAAVTPVSSGASSSNLLITNAAAAASSSQPSQLPKLTLSIPTTRTSKKFTSTNAKSAPSRSADRY